MPVAKTNMFSADAQINITSTTLECCLCSLAKVGSICTVPIRYFVSPILLPINLTNCGLSPSLGGRSWHCPIEMGSSFAFFQLRFAVSARRQPTAESDLAKMAESLFLRPAWCWSTKCHLMTNTFIRRNLQPFDTAPHVPAHLLSTFTNRCHLVICINYSPVPLALCYLSMSLQPFQQEL